MHGKHYKPLFPYFKHLKQSGASGAFRITCGTYVTTDSGTGVVHQAPFFGEVLLDFLYFYIKIFALIFLVSFTEIDYDEFLLVSLDR